MSASKWPRCHCKREALSCAAPRGGQSSPLLLNQLRISLTRIEDDHVYNRGPPIVSLKSTGMLLPRRLLRSLPIEEVSRNTSPILDENQGPAIVVQHLWHMGPSPEQQSPSRRPFCLSFRVPVFPWCRLVFSPFLRNSVITSKLLNLPEFPTLCSVKWRWQCLPSQGHVETNWSLAGQVHTTGTRYQVGGGDISCWFPLSTFSPNFSEHEESDWLGAV